jgi:hypothetical protein
MAAVTSVVGGGSNGLARVIATELLLRDGAVNAIDLFVDGGARVT